MRGAVSRNGARCVWGPEGPEPAQAPRGLLCGGSRGSTTDRRRSENRRRQATVPAWKAPFQRKSTRIRGPHTAGSSASKKHSRRRRGASRPQCRPFVFDALSHPGLRRGRLGASVSSVPSSALSNASCSLSAPLRLCPSPSLGRLAACRGCTERLASPRRGTLDDAAPRRQERSLDKQQSIMGWASFAPSSMGVELALSFHDGPCPGVLRGVVVGDESGEGCG